MKYLSLGKNEKVSCIGIGCMRIAGMYGKDVDTLVKTALDEGINFFDHADIYGGGQSEDSRSARSMTGFTILTGIISEGRWTVF